jgi:hypothetical protein
MYAWLHNMGSMVTLKRVRAKARSQHTTLSHFGPVSQTDNATHLRGGGELLGAADGGLGALVGIANGLLELVRLVAEGGAVHGHPRGVLVGGHEALGGLQAYLSQ